MKTRNLNEKAISYTPLQLAQIYNFPQADGTGQKIGIISLGGGYTMTDINKYLQDLGLPINPNVTNVSVNGAINNPNDTNSSIEVVLDLEIIVSIVPKAEIRMYFAPNSFTGFYNAILASINDGCKIVSISWGLYESGYGLTNLTAYNNLFKYGAEQGVTFCVAAGDNGSSDGSSLNNNLNVDFPSSSQYVVGCGGTTLLASNNTRVSEVVWNNNPNSSTGGGISKYFSKPSFQNNVNYPLTNRGVSDISCNADPYTGYRIYYRGNYIVIGGTSASAPLMAGLFARINQLTGQNVGFVNSLLYNNNIYYDIISGNNGAYNATINWDPASGCGVIDGQRLLNLFSSGPTASFTFIKNDNSVQFTNTSIDATSYLWDFGDNTTSMDTNPTHTFLPGLYTVTLKAINNDGYNTYSQNITFAIANFTASPLTGSAPLTVKFTNTSQYASNYIWQFGDNQTSTLINPSHVYQIGNYHVSLQADNDAIVKNNYISVKGLQANFDYSLFKQRLSLKNTSTGNPTKFKWQIGTMTSILRNPIYNYIKKGTYQVSLTIYKGNLTDTITKQITI